MNRRAVAAALAAAVIVLALGLARSGDPGASVSKSVAGSYGELPLAFEPNRGQAGPAVGFVARGAGYSLLVGSDDVLLELGGKSRLRMSFSGANPRARLLAERKLPGRVNYLRGNDPSRWLTRIPTYARVAAHDVYPGIDVAYYGRQGRLEYDFLLRPGADASVIALAFQGARELDLDRRGDLVLEVPGGTLRELRPVAYQVVDGARRPVAARFVVDGRRVSFELGRYDRSRTLVIDPTLDYSTYLGGASHDQGTGIAVDPAGSAYVTGFTGSADFPTATPLQATKAGAEDAFVTKLSPTGNAFVYSTYLGGSSDQNSDRALGITVDAAGSAYVVGWTASVDFPTTPFALRTTFGGGTDAFVSKLSADGGSLLYSTYLGGRGPEQGQGIAVDSTGDAYLTGWTGSPDFPTTPSALKPVGDSAGDAFVTKLSADGRALVYSTYLGGGVPFVPDHPDPRNAPDVGNAIAVDADGNAYVTGWTKSIAFPTVNALQPTYAPPVVPPPCPECPFIDNSGDGFVSKLNPGGTALVYSTYLGGSSDAIEQGTGIAVDAAGNAYVTGFTPATNFPTANALQPTFGGGDRDGFVSKLSANGALVYSTYLGGNGFDYGHGIAVDSVGNAYVVGETGSLDFPTVSPLLASHRDFAGFSPVDAFVSKLNTDGSAYAFSTYLGGCNNDKGYGIAVDASGNTYVTGLTFSLTFPTANAAQAQLGDAIQSPFGGSSGDAFVAKLGTATAAITLNCNTPPPTPTKPKLKVKKVVVGASTSPAAFSFQLNGGAAVAFEADGENVLELDPGTYTVTEPAVAGWTTTYETCTGIVLTTTQQTIPTCTVTNTQHATIVVQKLTVPPGSTQSFAFTPSYGPGFSLRHGESHTSGPLVPGAGYSVSETVPAGWGAPDASCNDGSPATNIDLSPGETVVCTFTNRLEAGPPVCVIDAQGKNAGGLLFIRFRVQAPRGLAAGYTVVHAKNVTIVVDPFAVGTTAPVFATATAITKASSAVTLRFFDLAGSSVECDPIMVLFSREDDQPEDETFHDVPQADRYVTIRNGDPGMRKVRLTVNDVKFKEVDLKATEVRSFDIGSAMRPGNENTITIRVRGKKGASTMVFIADVRSA